MNKSRYKTGDFHTIYMNPQKQTGREGRAVLKEFRSSEGGIELWMVEFLDQPGKLYPRYIPAGRYRKNVLS